MCELTSKQIQKKTPEKKVRMTPKITLARKKNPSESQIRNDLTITTK
jgi:hypothetical protein